MQTFGAFLGGIVLGLAIGLAFVNKIKAEVASLKSYVAAAEANLIQKIKEKI